MGDEEFAAFCAEHPDLTFEMTAEAELVVMPPNYSLTGVRNSRICRQLDAWTKRAGRGMSGDSSTGFVLPNGARRSPDASWTLSSRIAELDPASRPRYWHLSPDFVIELRSSSDRLKILRAKMEEWIENGTQLGWLIDPDERSVTVYRRGGVAETLANIESITGEGLLTGFVLDLRFVGNPMGGG